MIGIYKITSPSGKIYIGQSWNIETRFKHYSKLYKVKNQKALYNSFIKYGVSNHSFEILSCYTTTTQEELDINEIYYIQKYKNEGISLLNIKSGGSRGKHSEESKKIIKEKRKLQKMSDFQKERLRNKWTGEGNPNFGKSLKGIKQNRPKTLTKYYIKTPENNIIEISGKENVKKECNVNDNFFKKEYTYSQKGYEIIKREWIGKTNSIYETKANIYKSTS